MHFRQVAVEPGSLGAVAAAKFIFGSQMIFPYPYEMKSGKFLFRSGGGLGLISHTISVSGHYYDPSYGDQWFDESESDVDFLWHLDFGTIYLLTSKLGIDASIGFSWIYGNWGGNSYSTQNGFLFDFRAGLVFMI